MRDLCDPRVVAKAVYGWRPQDVITADRLASVEWIEAEAIRLAANCDAGSKRKAAAYVEAAAKLRAAIRLAEGKTP